ncbi:sigma 54-interacting transcriptional regulator, partial [Vibrio campbellii]|nr:sigma 54-interacting transcriptional regulator [Vibrio campbellii]
MRLEVFCEDRLGLTRELLDILASKSIDLRGIEIDISGIIYLNCPDIDFDTFSELMAEIRRIPGVKDVRKIQFMPMERHNTELLSLVDNLPEPVFAIDLKGAVDMANMAALSLLGQHKQDVIGTQIGMLLPSVRFSRWSEGVNARTRESLVIDGLDYILELMPVYIKDEAQNSTLASTLMTIRSSQHGAQIEEILPLNNQLGFEHFVGLSNRHKALMNQAKKLSVLDQPLLIEGETGTGKEMLAKACHSRSGRASKPFLVLSCAS